MIIHLPAILGFTRYQGFDPSPYLRLKGLDLRLADAASPSTIRLDDANDGGTINGQPGGLRNLSRCNHHWFNQWIGGREKSTGNHRFSHCIWAGWWFGSMEFYDFPFSWEWDNHPNWRTPSFFRGVGMRPNQLRFQPNSLQLRFHPPSYQVVTSSKKCSNGLSSPFQAKKWICLGNKNISPSKLALMIFFRWKPPLLGESIGDMLFMYWCSRRFRIYLLVFNSWINFCLFCWFVRMIIQNMC